jgi:hypothetical protein
MFFAKFAESLAKCCRSDLLRIVVLTVRSRSCESCMPAPATEISSAPGGKGP